MFLLSCFDIKYALIQILDGLFYSYAPEVGSVIFPSLVIQLSFVVRSYIPELNFCSLVAHGQMLLNDWVVGE